MVVIEQPALDHLAIDDVVPGLAARDPSGADPSGRVEVVPLVGDLLPALGHHTGVLVQVVRLEVDIRPAGQHGAVTVEVVPGAPPPREPAGLRGTVGVEVEPLLADLLPAGDHRACGVVQVVGGVVDDRVARGHQLGAGLHVVPAAADLHPATGEAGARGQVVAPAAGLLHPAGAHVAPVVEGVLGPVDGHVDASGVGAVRQFVPPPARGVLLPRSLDGRGILRGEVARLGDPGGRGVSGVRDPRKSTQADAQGESCHDRDQTPYAASCCQCHNGSPFSTSL